MLEMQIYTIPAITIRISQFLQVSVASWSQGSQRNESLEERCLLTNDGQVVVKQAHAGKDAWDEC